MIIKYEEKYFNQFIKIFIDGFGKKFNLCSNITIKELNIFLSYKLKILSNDGLYLYVNEVGEESQTIVKIKRNQVCGILYLNWKNKNQTFIVNKKNSLKVIKKIGIKKYIISYIVLKIFIEDVKEDYLYLDFIAIGKEFQHKGIGSKLLKFAINYTKNNKYESIVLKVIGSNTNAINLYTYLGFRKIKETNESYLKYIDEEKILIMEKKI